MHYLNMNIRFADHIFQLFYFYLFIILFGSFPSYWEVYVIYLSEYKFVSFYFNVAFLFFK